MNEFFTWGFLATYAGAAVATGILTQFFKEQFKRVPTQLFSYITAVVVLLAATLFTGEASSAADWAIVPLNAVLVSLASNGAYEGIIRIKDGKGGDGDDN